MINPESTQLSIIIPTFNESDNIIPLYTELKKVLLSLDMPWEIIFSDDGSSDESWSIIESLNDKDKRIKGIRLSKNFGHQYALLAGLSYAKGNAVISMDADLQHPPELIPDMVNKWHQGYKVVHTIRQESGNISFIKKTTSKLFYNIFSFLSGVKIDRGMSDFRLLDRKVLDNILIYREQGLFLRGIVQIVGYNHTTIQFQCRDRHSGTSKYTYRKMLSLAWNGISSFSIVPLRFGILIGIITSIAAFGEIIYAIYMKLFTATTVPGWASAVSILSFLFGILFILLGLVGEYIGKILMEVRNRPRFLISEQVGFEKQAPRNQ